MTGAIYILRNKLNGKCYVGQTIHSAKRRLLNHKSHPDMVIGKAIRKHGYDAFEIIEFTDIPTFLLDKFEIEMIKKVNCIAPNGYNTSPGGQSNKLVSAETRKKISESKMGSIPWNKGRPWSDKMKKRLSAANMGFVVSDEAREKISAAHRGIMHTEEHKKNISLSHMGKKYSAERRKQMSDVRMGKRAGAESPVAKKVICIETGQTFDTVLSASNYFNISHSCISCACSGKQKTAANYHWAYAEEQQV